MTADTAGSNTSAAAGRYAPRRSLPLARPNQERHASATSSAQPEMKRLDAGGTMLRLRALQVMGHDSARVARAMGAGERVIQRIVHGDTKTVSPALRDAVAWIYDRWWDKRAPERTRAERAAANAARRRAIRGNWCAGAGLDDDQLDRPGYQPPGGWRPAHGTGIAQDIRPSATRLGHGQRLKAQGGGASQRFPQSGIKHRTTADERKDTTGMTQPPDRDASHHPGSGRAPSAWSRPG
jgi:hypothetical protein